MVGCGASASSESEPVASVSSAVITLTSDRFESFEGSHDEEEAATARLGKIARAAVMKTAAHGAMATRDAHVKAHGLVKASVTMEADLPPFARGVGAFIPGKVYEALIRFSNGSGHAASDVQPDVRGLALKLINAFGPGKSQDFLTVSAASFPFGTLESYGDIFGASNPVAAAVAFATNPGDAVRFAPIALANAAPTSLADLTYNSLHPYLMGEEHAVKYAIKPCEPAPLGATFSNVKNRLRADLVEKLASGDICFHLFIQPFADQETTPIEDATVIWTTEFIKAATILIPRQEFDTPGHDAYSEQLKFNPWMGSPENAPLSKWGRVRKPIYHTTSEARHGANRVAQFEPTSLEIPATH